MTPTARSMPENVVHFVVYGAAATAGSKQSFISKSTGKIVTKADSKYQKAWQQEVRSKAAEAMEGRALLTGAVHLEASFAFVRPKSHHRAGDRDKPLKEKAPRHHRARPDLDKLLRALKDALNGVVWADDSQVCEVVANKFYGEPVRAWIQVREVE